jgi:hypothetical protein
MKRNRRFAIVAASLALLIGGAAFGQDEVDLKKGATLSPPETVSQSRDYLGKMKDTESRVAKLQEKAQKQKDVIKLNCVNDKLTQIKGHLTVAGQSMSGLETAVSQGDDGGRQHEFLRLTILNQKVIVLGTEAENCIGQDVSYVGKTAVEVEIAPWVPVDDATEPGLPTFEVTRPAEATPFV